jgi:hypothetical protein
MNMEDLLEWERQQLEQFGWFAHYVAGTPDCPNNTNYHTHGLTESFGHLDLQICLPVRHTLAHSIFSTVIGKIKVGQIFIEDKAYEEILKNYPLRFALAFESGRNVLRLLIPDEQGRLDSPVYNQQNDMLTDNNTPIVWD